MRSTSPPNTGLQRSALRRQLSLEQNQPDLSRDLGQSSGSHFARVLHIVDRPHFHQVPLFEAIAANHRNFWGTVYISPHDHIKNFTKAVPTLHCPDMPAYACLEQFLRRLLNGNYKDDPTWMQVSQGRDPAQLEGVLLCFF